jgi:hypothetical protein
VGHQHLASAHPAHCSRSSRVRLVSRLLTSRDGHQLIPTSDHGCPTHLTSSFLSGLMGRCEHSICVRWNTPQSCTSLREKHHWRE